MAAMAAAATTAEEGTIQAPDRAQERTPGRILTRLLPAIATGAAGPAIPAGVTGKTGIGAGIAAAPASPAFPRSAPGTAETGTTVPAWYPGMNLACYDYYAGTLGNCDSACSEGNFACGSYCRGDAACLGQCYQNTNACKVRCQMDFDERKHNVCNVRP